MTTPTLHEEARIMICESLLEGFDSPDDIISSIIERLSDENEEDEATQAVSAALPVALKAHTQAMKSWPKVTDCDRLDAAFEELNAGGIMARHNWTCCGTCGRAEMPDEFNRLEGEWEGTPIIGYTFYHQQGTEGAAAGGGLYLSYGSCEGADNETEYVKQCLDIAETVCTTLRKHDLKVTWDGSYDKTIHIDLKWQRRSRPPRFVGGDSVDGTDCNS